MGYSQSWLAIKGKSPQAVSDILDLRPTGEHEEFPESPFVSKELQNEWHLFVANPCGGFVPGRFLSERKSVAALEQKNQQLSIGCELVACDLEEHVMVSRVSGWTNGRKFWCVFHDAQEGIDHLAVDGDPPNVFGNIRDRLISEQKKAGGQDADVDYYFDIPIELGKALVGYRHDETVHNASSRPFQVLQGVAGKAKNANKSLWRKLFGF